MALPKIIIAELGAFTSASLANALRIAPAAQLGSDIGPAVRSFVGERAVSADQGKLKAALQANASLSISLLNSASDQAEDSAGVFGKAVVSEDAGINPAPRLHPNAERAWLKYAFSASLRAEIARNFGLASASIEASREVEYASYRPHPMVRSIIDAVAADLGAMPTILEVDDVASLAPGEAVSLRLPGKVALSIDLDESVFASTSLRPIAEAFGLSGPINLEFSRGLGFSVDLSFEDDTRLVFVGLDDGWIHASLRKARTSRFATDLGLQFKLGLSDASRQALITATSHALFGAAEEALDQLEQMLDFARISEAQQTLLQLIRVRMGLEENGQALLESVKAKLANRKEKLNGALNEILETRIEFGFKFEYNRVATDGSLFEARVSPAVVRQIHADLLRYDLRQAIDLVRRQGPGIRDFFLLHEKRVERKATLGYTFGFGKWLKLSMSSTGKRVAVQQSNHDGEMRQYWLSSREIAGSFNDKSGKTAISLRADTEVFKKSPTMADLKLSLSLDSIQQLDINSLPGLVDLAALWRVFSPSETSSQLARAKVFLQGRKDYNATISLRLSDRLVRDMATWLCKHGNVACAPILARSMPYWEGHAARMNESLREATYAPIFVDYLQAEDGPLLAQRVRNALHDKHPELAQRERSNTVPNLTFVGYVARPDAIGHRPIGMRLDALRRACFQIVDLPTRSADEMAQIMWLFFDQQKVFSQRSFTVRFLGALLAEVAISSGYPSGWQSAVTLSFSADGDTRSLVIGNNEI